MTDQPQIYVACLASYNNGVLHGAWIDCDSDEGVMFQEIEDRILKTSPYPNIEQHVYEDRKGREFYSCYHPFESPRFPANYDGTIATKYKGRIRQSEEYAIHDMIGIECEEYTPLEEIAEKIQFIDQLESDLGPDGKEIFDAYEECFGAGYVDDAETIRDAYAGHFDSEEDYAREYIDSTGMLSDAPDFLERYFDYEAFASDLFIDDMVMADNGHVFYRNH